MYGRDPPLSIAHGVFVTATDQSQTQCLAPIIKQKSTQEALKPKHILPIEADKEQRELKDLPGSLADDHRSQSQGDL